MHLSPLFSWILYLTGAVSSYIILRYMRRESKKTLYSWEDVLINIGLSFSSWLFIFFLILAMFAENFPKPPKFL